MPSSVLDFPFVEELRAHAPEGGAYSEPWCGEARPGAALRVGKLRRAFARRTALALAVGAALLCSLPIRPAAAADSDDIPRAPSGQPRWVPGAVLQALRMGRPATPSVERPPPTIPQTQGFLNASGLGVNFQPSGPTSTAGNAFFQPLGTNGRTCQTCHQPAAAFGITPPQIQLSFLASLGTAPLFRLVDGAVCPSADVSTFESRANAYSLVLSKGLIRIGLPLPSPPALQFSIVAVQDPYNCNTNPATGLTSYGPVQPSQGIVSVYRRPLPTTNLPFLTTIMWDGREPSLQSQAADAVMIHAQGTTPPSAAPIAQMVAFEQGLYSAQMADYTAGYLNDAGATGGPFALSQQTFYVGINDVLGGDPTGAKFNPDVMTLYAAWADPAQAGPGALGTNRAAIARGETLFNEKPILISGVAGLNDKIGVPVIAGGCVTCHDTPNVGDHSTKLPINIGLVAPTAAGLDTSGLPVFTLRCDAGPLAGQVFTVTDPGKALISGQCADIGKMKGPILRGLAARAPYFHNGGAARLEDAVDFYNTRFGIGFTDQEKSDLVAFLKTL